ncbi:MAG TPA: N-acetyl-alpha-D-glucosaminyl L-malate synthase BshA [Chitinophagaceae bacterium]|nr:N-acetyl-alpha-D-glucosaminyl L-malate synthase BshA [Chitinophagaceae bacterium]
MRIGIVCYPTYGGSGVLATELGKALADKGHQVHFITYQQPVRLDQFRSNIFYHEVQVPTYPLFDYPPYESALSSTLVDVALNNELDLLHVHYAIPHASTAFMAKKILEKRGKHLPVITTLHGTDITLVGKDKTYAPIVSFSINESDKITAVSKNLKQETLKHFRIEKEIDVVYNFIDTKRFKPHDHTTPCGNTLAPNGEKIVLHVSNFRPVKRPLDVVHIFKKINDALPSKLVLIGDGPERPKVENLCREYGICNDIHFLGKQEKLEALMSCTDLFLLPSQYESFGLAALEAMASEVPVISSRVGGLPEVNIHGKTGFLSPVGDIDDMAKHAIYILSDEDRLNKFRHQAYIHAQNFDIHHIIPQYEKLYKEVLQNQQAELLPE